VFVIAWSTIVLWITIRRLRGNGLISGSCGLVLAVNVVFTSIPDLNSAVALPGSIEKLAREDPYCAPGETSRGLVMVEIDGLSYHHLKHALETGQMPFLKWLVDQRGYALSKVDCGIPSQTSACQAGIMFGDNHDIPAYRWYDKEPQKLYVSASAAAEINARYAAGTG
jgi:predicted AlkP superfamily pyrophosphatase or phosphodiesterase